MKQDAGFLMQQFERKSFAAAHSGAIFTLISVLIALAGVALVLISTRWGPFLSDDTYYYVSPARDALAGLGFQPSYIFAPLFPLTLTGIGLFGVDVVVAARWLNAALFGVNILLVGHILKRLQVPPAFALVGSALVLLADVILEAHAWAMSEALSFTFLLLSIVFTLRHVASGKRVWWLLAAVASALTVLTRYAALPIVAAISLTLLIHAPVNGLWRRLREAVLFGFTCLLPIGVYWVRNLLVFDRPVRYEQFFHVPFTIDQLRWFLYHTISLFVPGRLLRGRELLVSAMLLGLAFLFIFGLWYFHRKQLADHRNRLGEVGVFLIFSFIGLNLLMLYFARGLTQLDVFNPRYLTPLLMVFIIGMTYFFARYWSAGSSFIRRLLPVGLALFLLYYGYRSFDFVTGMYRTGLGYSNVGWHTSETIDYIRSHPEMEMVSTGEMGIYFWTGRLPKVIGAFGGVDQLHANLCDSGATLFIMEQMPTEIYGLDHDQVVQGLELVKEFNDSAMYRCAD